MNLYEQLAEQGYRLVSEIEGQGLCGLLESRFTTAIVVGLTEHGYSHKFCYGSTPKAAFALGVWVISQGPEPENYILRKP